MSELSLSLTYAAICTTLITSGLAFATNLFVNESQIAHFGGTLLVASWLVLAQAKMWEGRTDDVGARRISQIVIGAGIGVISYCLGHLLVVDVPTADSITPAVHSIGAQSLVESGTNGQPSLPGYIVFFAALMGLRRWWRQVDSFRVSRLAIWPIVPSAVVALALTAIFAFPTVWGMIAAMAISVTVQLSAAWVPPRERAALVEGAIHA